MAWILLEWLQESEWMGVCVSCWSGWVDPVGVDPVGVDPVGVGPVGVGGWILLEWILLEWNPPEWILLEWLQECQKCCCALL